MSRRIDCTLTDTQHSLLWSALAYYDLMLEDEVDAGTASPATMAAFNRMCDRLRGSGVGHTRKAGRDEQVTDELADILDAMRADR